MDFQMDMFAQAMIRRAPPYILEHLFLVLVPMSLAVLIALPSAILMTRPGYRRCTGKAMALFSAGQTIPPLAVIAVFFPFFGLGYGPAMLALTVYALLPIARNAVTGIASVPEEIREAASGMGMTPWEVFARVELPLSIPAIMSGIRTSLVLTVSTAVLAALVGGKGMGAVIFAGINFFQPELILAGTIYIGIMAVVLERMAALLERFLAPAHLKSSV